MDEDEKPRRREYPISPAKMSKTPSWVMLGFVLGALFVVALPPRTKPEKAEPIRPARTLEFTRASPVRQPQPLTTVEDVFAVWGEHAVWSDDITEVAFWNKEYQDFTDYFEVRRINGAYYFRSIPRLTRRILNHGKPLPESPFRFTETEEQYREWLMHGRAERPIETRLYPTEPRAEMPRPTFDGRVQAAPPAVPPPTVPRIISTQKE
jgi:hypothetical protein